MNSLPLSWTTFPNPKITEKSVYGFNFYWLAYYDINSSDFTSFVKHKLESYENLLIRGCNTEIKKNLEDLGFSAFQIGYEAILNLNEDHFKKKSLKQLVRRGKRHGKVVNIPFSKENKKKLEELKKKSAHGLEPQLKNLFQVEFKINHYLYVFVDKNDNWLAAILLSKNSDEKLHTELLLRKPDSKIGVMEALVEQVYIDSQKNNFSELSLGEVPFANLSFREKNLPNFALKIFQTPLNLVYRYKTLYSFKEKFQPKWQEIYICSTKKIGIQQIIFLVIKSNFYKLIAYRILSKLSLV